MKKAAAIIMSIISAVTAAAQGKQEDWADFNRYSADNSTINASKKYPKAVFMGDSITYNWDLFDHEFFTGHDFLSRGISGQTSSHMLVRFRDDVINLKPEYVIILAGTNDLARNNGVISKEHVFGNIVSMCELARLHKIKPVVCSVLPAVIFSWRKELGNPTGEITALNGMLKEYAKKNGFTYVDYYSEMEDENHGLRKEYSLIHENGEADTVHPSVEGYRKMEEIILKHLK